MTRPDWSWPRVKYMLKIRRDLTLSDLARAHGLSHALFSSIPRRQRPRAQAIIAAALDRKPWDIWPSRYHRRGQPIRGWKPFPTRKPSKANTPRLAQKEDSS